MPEVEVELRHVPTKTCEKCGGHKWWCKVGYRKVDLNESFDDGKGTGIDVQNVEPIKCHTCENVDALELVPSYMTKMFFKPKAGQKHPKHV